MWGFGDERPQIHRLAEEHTVEIGAALERRGSSFAMVFFEPVPEKFFLIPQTLKAMGGLIVNSQRSERFIGSVFASSQRDRV